MNPSLYLRLELFTAITTEVPKVRRKSGETGKLHLSIKQLKDVTVQRLQVTAYSTPKDEPTTKVFEQLAVM